MAAENFAAPAPGAPANAKADKNVVVPEAAYREVPPAIEDVTIEGPTRTRIPHAQAHYDDLKLIASDYNWWRYSGCALPTLVVLGFLMTLVLGLTFWQGPMDIIQMRDGVARRFYQLDDDNDGDIKFFVGYIRITGFACGATATLAALLGWQIGKAGIIGLTNLVAIFFYLCASVCYWISFGFTATSQDTAHQCFRNQWVPENPGGRSLMVTGPGYQRCDSPNKMQGIADTANVIDATLGFFCFVSLVWLFLASGKKAWKRYTPQEVFKMKLEYGQPQREMKVQDKGIKDAAKAQAFRDTVNKGAYPQQHVKSVFRNFAKFLVYFTAALLVVSVVFTILLHESRVEQQFRGTVVRGDKAASYENSLAGTTINRHERVEYSGWPKINNRLRIAANASGLLLIILALVPWRSRVVAYCLGLGFLLVCILQFTAFGFDVKSIDDARNGVYRDIDADDSCAIPNAGFRLNCEFGGFEAVAVLEIFAAFVALWYLIYEYVLTSLPMAKCRYCNRKFPLFEKGTHEKSECYQRPVTCEICDNKGPFAEAEYDPSFQGQDGQKMNISAGYYYFQHRLTCGRAMDRCRDCGMWIPTAFARQHAAECPMAHVMCVSCGQHFNRCDMPQHVLVCPKRVVTCDACGQKFFANELDRHRAECPSIKVSCPWCGELVEQRLLAQHQELECPHRTGYHHAVSG